MMSDWSSFKEEKDISDAWRRFLAEEDVDEKPLDLDEGPKLAKTLNVAKNIGGLVGDLVTLPVRAAFSIDPMLPQRFVGGLGLRDEVGVSTPYSYNKGGREAALRTRVTREETAAAMKEFKRQAALAKDMEKQMAKIEAPELKEIFAAFTSEMGELSGEFTAAADAAPVTEAAAPNLSDRLRSMVDRYDNYQTTKASKGIQQSQIDKMEAALEQKRTQMVDKIKALYTDEAQAKKALAQADKFIQTTRLMMLSKIKVSALQNNAQHKVDDLNRELGAGSTTRTSSGDTSSEESPTPSSSATTGDETASTSTETSSAQVIEFEDLSRLTDQDLEALLRQVEFFDLVHALKGATQELQDLFLATVPDDEADQIREEMDILDAIDKSQIRTAQELIVSVALKLAGEGLIDLPNISDAPADEGSQEEEPAADELVVDSAKVIRKVKEDLGDEFVPRMEKVIVIILNHLRALNNNDQVTFKIPEVAKESMDVARAFKGVKSILGPESSAVYDQKLMKSVLRAIIATSGVKASDFKIGAGQMSDDLLKDEPQARENEKALDAVWVYVDRWIKYVLDEESAANIENTATSTKSIIISAIRHSSAPDGEQLLDIIRDDFARKSDLSVDQIIDVLVMKYNRYNREKDLHARMDSSRTDTLEEQKTLNHWKLLAGIK